MTNLRQTARGRECQVRSPVCNHNPETVVLAHLNGAGMGRKQPDWAGSWACSACHSWLDGGYVKTHTRDERDLAHLWGMKRTLEILFDEGLL